MKEKRDQFGHSTNFTLDSKVNELKFQDPELYRSNQKSLKLKLLEKKQNLLAEIGAIRKERASFKMKANIVEDEIISKLAIYKHAEKMSSLSQTQTYTVNYY